MSRLEISREVYRRLFGSNPAESENHPELMEILRRFIFCDVFQTEGLKIQTRELITVAVLSAIQTLPQLKAHVGAALNVGVSPLALREAVYTCAPFIGFPKTLNALGVVDEVFAERGIELPLTKASDLDDSLRYLRGYEIQEPLYGNEIEYAFRQLPDGYSGIVPRFLTEYCFGDIYSREGLDLRTRELLVLCVLTAIGAQEQISAHIAGNLKAGNDIGTLAAALTQTIPYIGFPYALNALKRLTRYQS